jgi:hypothetical protein
MRITGLSGMTLKTGSVSQQVWHVKEPSMLKPVSSEQRPVTGNGDSRQIAENLLVGSKHSKKAVKQKDVVIGPRTVSSIVIVMRSPT